MLLKPLLINSLDKVLYVYLLSISLLSNNKIITKISLMYKQTIDFVGATCSVLEIFIFGNKAKQILRESTHCQLYTYVYIYL